MANPTSSPKSEALPPPPADVPDPAPPRTSALGAEVASAALELPRASTVPVVFFSLAIPDFGLPEGIGPDRVNVVFIPPDPRNPTARPYPFEVWLTKDTSAEVSPGVQRPRLPGETALVLGPYGDFKGVYGVGARTPGDGPVLALDTRVPLDAARAGALFESMFADREQETWAAIAANPPEGLPSVESFVAFIQEQTPGGPQEPPLYDLQAMARQVRERLEEAAEALGPAAGALGTGVVWFLQRLAERIPQMVADPDAEIQMASAPAPAGFGAGAGSFFGDGDPAKTFVAIGFPTEVFNVRDGAGEDALYLKLRGEPDVYRLEHPAFGLPGLVTNGLEPIPLADFAAGDVQNVSSPELTRLLIQQARETLGPEMPDVLLRWLDRSDGGGPATDVPPHSPDVRASHDASALDLARIVQSAADLTFADGRTSLRAILDAYEQAPEQTHRRLTTSDGLASFGALRAGVPEEAGQKLVAGLDALYRLGETRFGEAVRAALSGGASSTPEAMRSPPAQAEPSQPLTYAASDISF